MAREFVLPDLGEGIAEAQIVRLLVKPGDQVAEDQPLMEVETDKAAVEIPSPFAGIAQEIHVDEGQTVNVGDVMITFADDGAAGAPAASEAAVDTVAAPAAAKPAPTAAPTPAEPGEAPVQGKTIAPAAPAVRKLAREMGIPLDTVKGSGPGGRITKEDLERHAAGPREVAAAPPAPAPAPARPAAPTIAPPVFELPPGTPDTDKWGPIQRVPLNQIRKTIANQMSRSAFTIPHVTHCDDADITELDRMRRSLNDATGGELKLTFMVFLIRALCIALRKYPIFNASFDEEGGQVIYRGYVNMGIAVDTERGLIVPVIRNADKLSLRGISAALRTLADRIRASEFDIEDLRGGTFTITNVGALGGTYATPIINHPEVAILGLGRSRQIPVIKEGEVTPALVLPLSLSFDHRATDGANAARFVREVVGYLETPAKLLLD
jgi:pyruvate dehydrogenase E2 component (dihydrolipoamide acetyltransferase)